MLLFRCHWFGVAIAVLYIYFFIDLFNVPCFCLKEMQKTDRGNSFPIVVVVGMVSPQ